MHSPIVAHVSSDALAKSAEWIKQRDELLVKAFTVSKVETIEDSSEAGTIQTMMSKHIKALEDERKRVTTPLDDVKKEIMSQEKDLRKNLEAERDRLKAMNDAFQTKLAMEREAARRKAEDDARRAAQAAAEEAAAAAEAFGDDVVVEAAPVAEVYVPPVAKLENSKVVKRWEFAMVDSSMVPTDFLILNDKAVRALINTAEAMGKDPVLAGVKFTARMSVESK